MCSSDLQCLHSVLRATQGIETEIFVVDNNSTDDTVSYLHTRFPEITIIANHKNVGFARANNQAIARAQGEYVLLLNPDTIVSENTFAECIAFMDAHPQAGGTGVRMLKSTGGFALESRRGLPSPFTAFCKMTGLCHLFPRSRKLGKYYMRYLDETQVNEIDIISGAFAFFRHSALKDIGLLDETFFMYGEDIDLSHRMQLGGYKNYYLPTPILHYKGESTEKSSFRYVHVFYNAMLIFFNKHYGHYRFWFSFPIRSAIYFRGVMAFTTQQTERLRNMLGIIEKTPPTPRYLLIGSKMMIQQAGSILNSRGIPYDSLESDENLFPEGHLQESIKTDLYNFVVYDVSSYSYQNIFSIMEKSAKLHKRLELGTFSMHTGLLITHQSILE